MRGKAISEPYALATRVRKKRPGDRGDTSSSDRGEDPLVEVVVSIRFRNCMCRNLHDNYMSRIMAYDLYRVLNGSAGHTCSGEHVAAIHLRIYRGKAP